MNIEVNNQFHQFISHAYQNSAAVKDIFDRAGLMPDDVQSIHDLEKIPVTSKDRLVELQNAQPPFGGFLAVPMSDLQHVFFSPGPIYEPHTGQSNVLDSIREVLAIAGFGAEDVVLNTFGYHLIPTGLTVDQMLREIKATVIPAGVGNAELQVKILKDLRVTGYVGTPSWLMTLIKKMESIGQDISKEFHLEKALVSAEPLPPSMREVFTDQHGLRITNAYGTAELGFLAVNIDGGLQMQLLETSIIEIVNPDNGKHVNHGEVGEVVVTTMDSAFPLIRLGTGDLAIFLDPTLGESQQKDRSIILVGRIGEAVKVRGMFVHPNQLRHSASQVLGIANIQAIVSRSKHRDSLTIRVLLKDHKQDQDVIQENLKQVVESVCRVNIDQIIFINQEDFDPDEPIIVDQRSWE